MSRFPTAIVSTAAMLVTIGALAEWPIAARQTVANPAPSQTPTFRAGTSLVPIDVRVVDAKGNPVTDLTREDFVVLENDVRQQIRVFSTVDIGASAGSANEPLMSRAAGDPLAPHTRRVFLLVMGRGRLQVPSKGVDAALQFIRTQLLPQDQVAILAWNRATAFTTDHERTALVMTAFRARHEKIETMLAEYFRGLAAVHATAIPKYIQDEIDGVFGAEAARPIVPTTPANQSRMEQDVRGATDVLQYTSGLDVMAANAADVIGMSFDDFVSKSAQSTADLMDLYTGVDYLRFVEGEKHLVFFSESGLMLPRLEDDTSLAAAASDARVVIDTIQTGGTPPAMTAPTGRGGAAFSTFASHSNDAFSVRTLRTLSELTGGQWSARAMAAPVMSRIDSTSRSGYQLGYSPSNAALDGSYRRVTVRVNRPGLTVLYRHGYFARSGSDFPNRRALQSYVRIVTAANYAGSVPGPITGFTAVFEPADGRKAGTLNVTLTLGPAGVSLQHTGDRYTGSVRVAVFCGDAQQQRIGEIWQMVDLNLRDQTYQGFLKSGLVARFPVPVTTRPSYAKAIVYDFGSDLTGSISVAVK